jgi:hypothetical protein
MPQVFQFDHETRIFSASAVAVLDRLGSAVAGKDVYLLPANAAWNKPPEQAGHVARAVSISDGVATWELVEDHREEARYSIVADAPAKALGSKVDVKEVGTLAEVAPDTTAIEPPEVPQDKCLAWTGDDWALEDLPPPPAPETITMRQARLALLQIGLLDQVNQAILAMPGDAGVAARIEWEYAKEISIDNPLFAMLAGQLGLSGADLENLMRTAATL